MQQRIERRRQRGHPAKRAHWLLVGIAVALAAGGCKEDADKGPAAAEDGEQKKPAAELEERTIPGTPLQIDIPADWRLDDVDPGPAPAAPGADGGPAATPGKKPADKKAADGALALKSRTMLSARAPDSQVNDKLSAWLMVLHDPFLPAGTTSTDYLKAQRDSNQQAIPDLKHVEAERSRRQGRPAYYVRDEWTAPLTKDEQVDFSQETLLLIDAQDGRLHGYSVTITLPKKDRQDLEMLLRKIVKSVRFQKK